MAVIGLFEWDERKEASNRKKHGISFREAVTVFFDTYSDLFHDPDHSVEEDRFILLGMSQSLRVLVVCHTYRARYDGIRIISARKADKKEMSNYGI